MPTTLGELADRIGATIEAASDDVRDRPVTGCAPIRTASSTEITFVANAKYARWLVETDAAAVLVHAGTETPEGVVRLVCRDPYRGFRDALVELAGFREHPSPIDAPAQGRHEAIISEKAAIHHDASIANDAIVHPFVTVERGASVGPRSVLYPGTWIGPDAHVGADCVLYPNVTVYDRCLVGDRVTLHASTVIGLDGFGYATDGGVHHKIPQTGIAVIEDDVELGAGCAIERAAMGETRIGAGTKFADLVSIGHGTTVGRGCLFVSLVGVSGSVEIGDHVVLGGQVGVAGHLRIGDRVQAAGRTGIASDVEDDARIGGTPAVDIATMRRNLLVGRDLGGMAKRVRELERTLEAVMERLDADGDG